MLRFDQFAGSKLALRKLPAGQAAGQPPAILLRPPYSKNPLQVTLQRVFFIAFAKGLGVR